MDNFYTFFIFALSTWRITSMFVDEEGPGNMFIKFRDWIGVIEAPSGVYGKNFFASIFACLWCASVWIAALWVIAELISPQLSLLIASPFALSAAAIFFDKQVS